MIGERRASEKYFGRSSNRLHDTLGMRDEWIGQHDLCTAAGDWPSSRRYWRLLAHRRHRAPHFSRQNQFIVHSDFDCRPFDVELLSATWVP